MPSDRISKLENLSFVWDVRDELWETQFQNLLAFSKREGHTRVPRDHVENGHALGNWVDWQKYQVDQGRMEKKRYERLKNSGVGFSEIKDGRR